MMKPLIGLILAIRSFQCTKLIAKTTDPTDQYVMTISEFKREAAGNRQMDTGPNHRESND